MARGGIDFFDSKECEWADCTLSISGATVTKFTRINWGVKTAKTHLHAAGDDPASIQSGNREPQGGMTLLKGAFDAFMVAAKAAGGRDITDVEFEVVVYWKPKGTRAPQTTTLIGCQISEFDVAAQQNDPKVEVALPFLFLRHK